MFRTTYLLLLFLIAGNLFAQFGGKLHTQASLVTDAEGIVPGQPLWVALRLEMDEGWHTYYKEPGDAGMPTSIEWMLPEGWTAGDIVWPKPIRFETSGIESFGYKDIIELPVQLHAPSTLTIGDTVELKANAYWLECMDICIAGNADVLITLPIITEGYTGEFQDFNKTLKTEALDKTSPVADTINLPLILLFAFLGGLALNVMPCVFPVIGLKILGFAKAANEDPRERVKHGVAFSAGVIGAFWLMGALFLSLKAAGEAVGWGYQMQSPEFVFTLAALFLILGLNMSGVFHIGYALTRVAGKADRREGLSGSVASGAFSTVAATPCGAPLFAGSLAVLTQLPQVQAMLVLTTVGLGLAAPYMILSAMPKLTAKMPKPGRWMESFKQFLAFPLYASTGALVWVLAGQVDKYTLLYCILGLSGIALGMWVYGRWGTPTMTSRNRMIAHFTAMAILAFCISFVYGALRGPQLIWDKWSPERVEQLLDEGRPVYVDFTARWCATCLVNKQQYKNSSVYESFEENNVALLEADWTNFDPSITETLNALGRETVPTNVLYIPDKDKILLPTVLTEGNLLEALEQIESE